MNRNLFQQQVTPLKPKILGNERVFVYVAPAEKDAKGIASFGERDFALLRGHVTLKWSMEQLVEGADPTVRPSFIKVLPDEFIKTNTPTTITNTSGQSYTTNKAELALNRFGRDAIGRPDLVMLDAGDFESTTTQQGYNKYKIMRKNPFLERTLIKVNSGDFIQEGDAIRIRWPQASDGDYGLVKIAHDGGLKHDSNNELAVDTDYLKRNIDVKPIYSVNDPDYYDNVTGLAKKDANGNVMIKITKEAVGLGNVENRTFASRVYDEFGPTMKGHFNTEFNKKLDRLEWNRIFADWDQDAAHKDTAQKWFEYLEQQDDAIRDSIQTSQSFLGVFVTPESLMAEHDAEQNMSAFIISTGSYWATRNNGGWEWYDTEIENLNFSTYVETNVSSLRPNSASPSTGTSGKWIQSDHVHPSDSTKLDKDIYDNTIINIQTVAPNSNDFEATLSDSNIVINIPYVRTAQYLHNWKSSPSVFNGPNNEYYWAGTMAEFEQEKDLIPAGAFINIDDGEELLPGNIVVDTQLEDVGIILDGDDKVVVVDKNADIDGVSVVLNNGKLEALSFGTPWQSSPHNNHRMVISVPHENGTALALRRFTSNKLIKSDANGNLEATEIGINDVLTATDSLTNGSIIIAENNKSVTSFDSGEIADKLLVSDSQGGIKLLTLTANKLLKTKNDGGITVSNINEDTLVKSTEPWYNGKVVLTGSNNTVIPWNGEGVEGSLIVRGADEGTIKIKSNTNLNRILITGSNGTFAELPAGTDGEVLVSKGSGAPVWESRTTPLSLPQTVLSANPSQNDAAQFNGLVAVFLDSPIQNDNDMQPNCIYYW